MVDRAADGAVRAGGAAAGQGGGVGRPRRRGPRRLRRRPVHGRVLHRLRHARPRHPARPRPRHARRRAAAVRRPHGLLRRAAGARRGGRLTSRAPRPAGPALPRAAEPARAARDAPPGRTASEDDLQQMVAHALFSDAAAAVVVLLPDGPGCRSCSTSSRRHRRRHRRPHDVGRHRSRLPDGAVAAACRTCWRCTSARRRRAARRARARRMPTWPAGRCTPAARASSTWCRTGSSSTPRAWRRRARSCATSATARPRPCCSSSTGCSRRGVEPGQHVVAMAFGPGLTLYAALLRVVGR